MEQDTDKLNEIVEPAHGAELLSESKPKKKAVVKPEPLIEGQVIGGKFIKTAEGKLLHTKEGKVAKFATKGGAIIASKRYGGRLSETTTGFVVRG